VVPTAAHIANAYGAELLLVHVVHEPLPTSVLRSAEDLEIVRKLALRLESDAKEYLEQLRQRLTRHVDVVRTLAVRHGNERRCLLDIVQRERSDFIVLSAHGSACDPTRSFGSVTADLLSYSMVPVLVLQDLPGRQLHAEIGEELAPPLRASFPPEAL
jgi:nucleotide-binding universal stress UspA family protein